MPDLTAYYRRSLDYRRMLAEQDAQVFAPYVACFRRWARPGSRVLDVGCGTGTSTRRLRDAGFDAMGADVSEAFLPAEEGFVVADFNRRTDLDESSLSAAGALNVLEHVAHPRAFLDELVRIVEPRGIVILASPNLTSPLVAVRVAIDLARRRTPYLGVRRPSGALTLLSRNVVRSGAAALGRDAFAPRVDTLASGIVGFDVDAVYWTNPAEVRRHLEHLGCEIVQYQGEGRSLAARLVARLAPSFAGQLMIVARVAGPS